MSEPIKIPLSKSITAHGEEISELTLRPMKVGDLRGFKVTLGEGGLTLDLGSLLDLGARLANVPPSSMDAITFPDAVAIGKAVTPLLDGLLPTGKTLSPE